MQGQEDKDNFPIEWHLDEMTAYMIDHEIGETILLVYFPLC